MGIPGLQAFKERANASPARFRSSAFLEERSCGAPLRLSIQADPATRRVERTLMPGQLNSRNKSPFLTKTLVTKSHIVTLRRIIPDYNGPAFATENETHHSSKG